MAGESNSSLTGLGKLISFMLVLGLLGFGGYVVWNRMKQPTAREQGTQVAPVAPGSSAPGTVAPKTSDKAQPDINTKSAVLNEVPRFGAPGAYQMKNNTVDIELSNYMGYSGLIVANNGLAASEDSIFFKKFGFKVKITLKEEESRGDVHTGRLAAVATTADVLACYGKDFNVIVPAQIGYSRGADGIIVTSDINRINQLKGKVLSASQFSESEFFIRYLGQEAGLGVNYIYDLNDTPNPDKINLFFCEDAFGAADLFLKDLQSGRGRLTGSVSWAPKTTEVVLAAGGKAKFLVTNQNLLLVGDVLVVNKPFAKSNPKVMQGLVEGLLEGNRKVRENPEPYLDQLVTAFNTGKTKPTDLMDRKAIREELQRVHLSNLPENVGFFTGDISMGGSFAQIFSSAVLTYGSLIRDPVDADYYTGDARGYLDIAKASGVFAGETAAILPIKSSIDKPLESDPLLSKNIRFFFEPNSAKLDMSSSDNKTNLLGIVKMLQISPGSKVLLRGHVDNARVPEFQKMGGEAMVQQQALQAMQLSKNRASEVKRVLVENHNVDDKRIDTIGRGWQEPAGSDSEKNRRVEVYWYTLE